MNEKEIIKAHYSRLGHKSHIVREKKWGKKEYSKKMSEFALKGWEMRRKNDLL